MAGAPPDAACTPAVSMLPIIGKTKSMIVRRTSLGSSWGSGCHCDEFAGVGRGRYDLCMRLMRDEIILRASSRECALDGPSALRFSAFKREWPA